MFPISDQTAIVGAGYTPMVRQTQESVGAIAVKTALDAIRDAGLMVSALGLREPRWVLDIRARPTGAVLAAAQALYAGMCRHVLILRTMYNPTDIRYPQSRRTHVPGPEQFTLPFGLGGAGGHHAPRLARYMHEYGATREELYSIAQNARRNAQLNPIAAWYGHGELSPEEYINARWIYRPMCLFDCDMPVTGAGALVLTTADRARDLPNRPAYLTAYCNVEQPGGTIFELAGIDRKDVQVAQIYDGYSLFVWEWLEKLGFCGVGEAHTFTQGARIGLGGELPLNTFGGNLGEGRLHGMGHVREGAMQVMSRCGDRQVPGVEHCLVAAGGIPNDPHILMLRAGPSA